MFDSSLIYDLWYYGIEILAFICAITFHEFMHGFVAFKLGDRTAARNGRLSFNPIRHVDPFGTLILPALLLLAGMPVFGYAKPVPFNPNNFKDPKKGELYVALAGPLGNLLLAVIGALLLLGSAGVVSLLPTVAAVYLQMFLQMLIIINLYLMFFNLIPIPPLDGASIVVPFIPDEHMDTYYTIQQYALPVFMIAIILLPQVFNVDPIGWYLSVTAGNVYHLLVGLI